MNRRSVSATTPEIILSRERRQQRALLAGAIATFAALACLLPLQSLPAWSCAFHDSTGHSCFTCGLTRSLAALIHGNLPASVGYHLMGPLLVLALVGAIIKLGVEALTGRRWNPGGRAEFWRRTLVLFVLVWILYGGTRLALEFAG